jgi:peptidoglycan/LPS O-acetylase OafA/YrhL
MSDYLIQFLAFGVIALLVVLPATFGAGRKDIVRRFLEHPLPIWLGLISYGIFLWQFPVLIAALDLGVADWWPSMQFPVLVLVTLAGTIACAAISYYVLERPLMRWGRRSPGSTPPEGPAIPATANKPSTS